MADIDPYKKIAILEIQASKTVDNIEREKLADEMHRRTVAIIGTRKGLPALHTHIGRSQYNGRGELVGFRLELLNKPKRELTETNKP